MKNKILAMVWMAFVVIVPCMTSTAMLFWGLRLNEREIVAYSIPYFVIVARFWDFAMYQMTGKRKKKRWCSNLEGQK